MANQQGNNIKLGAFMLSGVGVLLLAFYMIGINHSFFGSSLKVKVQFTRVNGLTEGDNVLYSGIQAGTVNSIKIINDTTIEAVLLIDSKVKSYIHKNAVVSIGTDGLMGNKVVNIFRETGLSDKISEGDLLTSRKMVDMDEMLLTFSKTNNNAAIISEALKNSMLKINESAVLKLLTDKELGILLKSSLSNINRTTTNTKEITSSLASIISHTKQGKGAAGVLLYDTSFAADLKQTMHKVRDAGNQVDQLVAKVNLDLDREHSPLNVLLRDSAVANNLIRTLDNVQKGTDGFNQNMEALKHNFFFRGYFKNIEKQKKENEEKRKTAALKK